MTEDERLLASVPLFHTLPPAEIQGLARSLQSLTLAAGAVLFREGEPGDVFYVVAEGLAEIVKALGSADERRVGARGPGEFLGEMSLLGEDGRRTASVRAAGPVRLWAMTRADFDALLARHPRLAYEMVRVLSRRLNASHNHAIQDLQAKNRQLTEALTALQMAQTQLVEKERLERELQVAYEIQMGLLPRALPALPGFEFAARLEPARAVGGDWFDFIPLGLDRLGLVVGDVTDKGVPAALFMAQVHALLRAEARRGASPAETLRQVNAHLLEMNGTGLFATVIYGVLDARAGRFAYARAGHEPPWLCGPDGAAAPVPTRSGMPIGVMDDPLLDEQVIAVPPGGLLVLFTDGLTEAWDLGRNPFGEARLAAALAALAGRSAAETCDGLMAAARGFQGQAEQHDDLTLLVVRSLG